MPRKKDLRTYPQFLPDRVPKQWKSDLSEYAEELSKYKIMVKKPNKPPAYNIPCTFDTETTSFYNESGEKVSIVYEWTATILNHVYIGRFMDELVDFFDTVGKVFCGKGERIIFFVHNLSFDFNMIRSYFEWKKVFAVDRRKPVYAIMDNGVELRCSYVLTGYSLDDLGKKLKKYKDHKHVGDLDYSQIRTPETPLTKQELSYCIADCFTLAAYIMEEIEKVGDILNFPLTKTGYIRRLCREKCLKDNWRYKRIIGGMPLIPEEYDILREAYQGGFTHAGALNCQRSLSKIHSIDFCSAYPFTMCACKFPMGRAHIENSVTIKQFEKMVFSDRYCCVFSIAFNCIRLKDGAPDAYISGSHSVNVQNATYDNGRISEADHVEMTITDLDFQIIQEFYIWDGDFSIANFMWYDASYLPKSFIMTILELYEKKTKLKGVHGLTDEGIDAETEYMKSKELLNSAYGMMCTDPCQEINDYSDHWEDPKEPDKIEALSDYTHNFGRFSHYSWGVWVCAWTRFNLLRMIYTFGDDYVYADTDSIKFRHYSNHKNAIAAYNDEVKEKLTAVSEYYDIPFEKFAPTTKKGKIKMLGVFEYEGYYQKFKALRAKCYLTKKAGKWSITVSGLNKRVAAPYLLETYKGRILEAFNENLSVPKGKTGKLTHTYIDEPREGVVKDKDGISRQYSQLCGVHMEPADYHIGHEMLIYKAFVQGVQHRKGVFYG